MIDGDYGRIAFIIGIPMAVAGLVYGQTGTVLIAGLLLGAGAVVVFND